jgi:hypothetical protein
MMDDADRLRNRAPCLWALEILVREQGHIEHSDQLTQLASEILVDAEEMAKRHFMNRSIYLFWQWPMRNLEGLTMLGVALTMRYTNPHIE